MSPSTQRGISCRVGMLCGQGVQALVLDQVSLHIFQPDDNIDDGQVIARTSDDLGYSSAPLTLDTCSGTSGCRSLVSTRPETSPTAAYTNIMP